MQCSPYPGSASHPPLYSASDPSSSFSPRPDLQRSLSSSFSSRPSSGPTGGCSTLSSGGSSLSGVQIRPGVLAAAKAKVRGRGAVLGGGWGAGFGFPTPPSSSPAAPEVTPERVERIFLNASSFPLRVTSFVAAFRARLLSASALYPPDEPYRLSAEDVDIVSVPDFSAVTAGQRRGATWVRVPALRARPERLPVEERKRVVAAAMPSLPSPSSLTMGPNTWTFRSLTPELDTALWDLHMQDTGERVRVAFDQALLPREGR
ncbi:hypothetical protein JCM10213_000840 [Rhodosporidiobolus nylandii]